MFRTLFLHHPNSVGESYFGHMRFALGFSARLLVAAMAALAHALIPALCQTTASRIVRGLEANTRHRRPATGEDAALGGSGRIA